jgi:hypothetical protein
MIDKLEMFGEFRGRDLTSHTPSLATYERMLAAYKQIDRSLGSALLSAAQLIQILNEQTHPERRS